MLSEKWAKQLTEAQLRELIRKQGRKANRNLLNIRQKKLSGLSGAMKQKIEPYLRKHGRQTQKGLVFKTSLPKNASKSKLINTLLNIQYFNRYVGTATKVKKEAEEKAKRQNIDIEDIARFWTLYSYGLNAVGYKVDSGALMQIIEQRIRGGQSDRTIKNAIRKAAAKADNATDYLTILSEGGRWI